MLTTKPFASTGPVTDSGKTRTLEQLPPDQFTLALPGSTSLAGLNEEERVEQIPYAFIAWGVQRMKSKPGNEDVTGKFVLAGNDKVQVVPIPHTITVLAMRPATKELVQVEGKNRNKRSFGNSKVPAMQAEYAAQRARYDSKEMTPQGFPAVELGNMYLIAVLAGTGTSRFCCIAILEGFKSQLGYWKEPLESALIDPVGAHKPNPAPYLKPCGIMVGINDHAVNETASKTDARKVYFDRKKFNQWSRVELSADDKKLIQTTYHEHKAVIDAWLAK